MVLRDKLAKQLMLTALMLVETWDVNSLQA